MNKKLKKIIIITATTIVLILISIFYFSIMPRLISKNVGRIAVENQFMTQDEYDLCTGGCLERNVLKVIEGINDQIEVSGINFDTTPKKESILKSLDRKLYLNLNNEFRTLMRDFELAFSDYENLNNFSKLNIIKQDLLKDTDTDFKTQNYRITNFFAIDVYLIADLIPTEGTGDSALLIIRVETEGYRLVAGPGTYFNNELITKNIPPNILDVANKRLSEALVSDTLIEYLPHINPDLGFEITYSSHRGSIKYKAILYGNSDDDFLKAKGSALNWIKSKKIDAEKINIEFEEKSIVRPKENYLE
jgi:hypothetical protein